MNSDARDTLLSVFRDARIASLGTIHSGEPAVSMVPFALLPDGAALVIHVSGLSAHTADMLASPRVSALVIASRTADVLPQALPRVTVRADAIRLAETDVQYASARSAYLERFPDAEAIFGLGDFSLFLLRPLSARVIGGFGRAATVNAQDLSDTLAAI